jgi:hypothetical protein
VSPVLLLGGLFDDHAGAWEERRERFSRMRTAQADVRLGPDRHDLAEWFADAELVEIAHAPSGTGR